MKRILTIGYMALAFPGLSQSSVSGTIYWRNGMPLDIPATVTIKYLNHSDEVYLVLTVPAENGMYHLNLIINPLITQRLIISVNTDVADARTGVSVLDLVRIQRVLLGLSSFTDALQQYAADINSSGTISALDLIEIRKLILGEYDTWPSKAVVQFFHRPNAVVPPLNTVLLSEVSLVPEINDDYTIDFWAVKVGDVN